MAAIQNIGELAFRGFEVLAAPCAAAFVAHSGPCHLRTAAQFRNVPAEQIATLVAIEEAVALQTELGLCQLGSPFLKPAYLRFRGVGTVIEIVRREFRVRASFRFNRRMARATPVTRRDDDVVPVRDRLDSSSVA